ANAGFFRGHASRITSMGHEAGAASVSDLFLSTTTRSLVARGILQWRFVIFSASAATGILLSGACTASWVFKSIDEQKRFSGVLDVYYGEMPDIAYTDWSQPDDTLQYSGNPGSAIGDRRTAIGDRHFVCPVKEFYGEAASTGIPVYHYPFTYVRIFPSSIALRFRVHEKRPAETATATMRWEERFSTRSSLNPWGTWMGTIHSEELPFIEGFPFHKSRGYTRPETNFTTIIYTRLDAFLSDG
ncbi:unnamed protein product, partial [Darwinula stevensoni]